MQSFDYCNRTKIIFGKGTARRTGAECALISKRILLLHSGGHVVKSGLLDAIKETLEANDVSYIELSGVKPNPLLSKVREGITIARENNLSLVLAVGGGSVIDTAKAIALGAVYDGDVWDFYDHKREPENALNVATVVTIPAAGSENSIGSVITNEEGPWKQSVDSELIRPVFSILDPVLTYSLPDYQTACGITDIFAHIAERYFTRERHAELSDEFCEGAMRTVIRNGRKILSGSRDDYYARSEIMWASTIAHNNLLSSGRIGDWGSHMIEHQLSAFYDIAHGAGLAIIMPAWMQYVLETDKTEETVLMFAKFAKKVWGVDGAYYDAYQAAEEGIFRFKNFLRSIGMPTSFKDAGIGTDKIDAMVVEVVKFGSVGHYIELKSEDVRKIYDIASSL